MTPPSRKPAKTCGALRPTSSGKLEEAQRQRRESFSEAQKAGLSLRDISQEVGLHWTRVGQILRGE